MMSGMGEGDTIARYPGLIDAFVAAGSDSIAGQATQQELRALIRGLLGFRPRFRFDGGAWRTWDRGFRM